MLREARLLDSLSHECIVPLERGWLEQRAGLEQPAICACAFCWSGPLVTTRTIGSEDVDDTTPAEEHATGEDYLRNGSSFQCRDRVEHTTDVLEDGRSNLRQPHLRGATATAPRDSIVCCGGCGQTGNPVRFSVRSGYGFRSEDDAVAFLLRSWVPLTVGDLEVDDDEYDRVEADQDEGGEVVGSNKNIGEGGSRSASQYGGVEQLRWGGDGTTDWRGTAEPKSTADGPNSTTNTPAAEKPFDRKTPDPRVDEGGGNRMAFLYGERIVCLTSYLLLPDWLPLSVWFVTEFEPRTAASDEQDGTATTGVVTAPDDWALVWRHLLSMFVQVRDFVLLLIVENPFWSVEGLILNTFDNPLSVADAVIANEKSGFSFFCVRWVPYMLNDGHVMAFSAIESGSLFSSTSPIGHVEVGEHAEIMPKLETKKITNYQVERWNFH